VRTIKWRVEWVRVRFSWRDIGGVNWYGIETLPQAHRPLYCEAPHHLMTYRPAAGVAICRWKVGPIQKQRIAYCGECAAAVLEQAKARGGGEVQ
jgi:hypothetical protein